jgi:hypothetical protein
VLGAHATSNGQALDYLSTEIPVEVSDLPAAGAEPHDPKSLGFINMAAEWQVRVGGHIGR